MSTTAYDHHDIDSSQSPFFCKIEPLPSVTDGHLGVKCTKGKGVRVYSGGGGWERKAHTLPKGWPILIPRLQSWTKNRRPTLRIWHHGDPFPTPPWSMLFSRGKGGSILSEPGFRGKYCKIRHTRCIFLNIFVRDCRLVTGARCLSATAGARFLRSHGKIGK